MQRSFKELVLQHALNDNKEGVFNVKCINYYKFSEKPFLNDTGH